MLKGEPTRLMKNNRGAVAATRIVKTGTEALRIDNIGTQRGDPEEDDNGIVIGTSTANSRPPATAANEKLAGVPPVTSRPESPVSPVLRSYPVGRSVSLPFGQALPECDVLGCSCNALIAYSSRSDPSKENGVRCLDHGLNVHSSARGLVLKWSTGYRYRFISLEHETAIRTFLN